MPKTEMTKNIEKAIAKNMTRQGVWGCPEVTIGMLGNQRVDFMTYDSKNIFRCYEIKVSKSDFRSKAKLTFIGNYNYFVMPIKLCLQLQGEIPSGIGLYAYHPESETISCEKKATKRELGESEQILSTSLIRCLARDAGKWCMQLETPMQKQLESKLADERKNVKRIEKEKRDLDNALRYEQWCMRYMHKYGCEPEAVVNARYEPIDMWTMQPPIPRTNIPEDERRCASCRLFCETPGKPWVGACMSDNERLEHRTENGGYRTGYPQVQSMSAACKKWLPRKNDEYVTRQ